MYEDCRGNKVGWKKGTGESEEKRELVERYRGIQREQRVGRKAQVYVEGLSLLEERHM